MHRKSSEPSPGLNVYLLTPVEDYVCINSFGILYFIFILPHFPFPQDYFTFKS